HENRERAAGAAPRGGAPPDRGQAAREPGDRGLHGPGRGARRSERMSTVVGVVTFPGSLDDRDAVRAVARAGATPVRLWHADSSLHGVDAVVLPGGFSYGDYLRCGAIARFSAVMTTI